MNEVVHQKYEVKKMIGNYYNKLEKIADLIEKGSEVSVTLDKNDLVALHASLNNEKLAFDRFSEYYVDIDNRDEDMMRSMGCEVSELRADSITEMEVLVSNIVTKLTV